jgi:hypothetical protein
MWRSHLKPNLLVYARQEACFDPVISVLSRNFLQDPSVLAVACFIYMRNIYAVSRGLIMYRYKYGSIYTRGHVSTCLLQDGVVCYCLYRPHMLIKDASA